MRRAAKLSERGGLPGGCPGPPGTRTKKLEPTAMGSIMQGARGQMRRRVVDSAEWTDRRRGAAWTDMNRARWFYTEVNSTAVQSRAEQSSVKQCCEAPAGNLASRHGSTPTARRLGDAVDLHCTALDHRPAAADKHLNSAKPPSHGQKSRKGALLAVQPVMPARPFAAVRQRASQCLTALRESNQPWHADGRQRSLQYPVLTSAVRSTAHNHPCCILRRLPQGLFGPSSNTNTQRLCMSHSSSPNRD